MATGKMQPDEALALARLRQWSYDRIQLASARTVDHNRRGWTQRNSRTFDARLVRVIDFSRALADLQPLEQAALILIHRDRETVSRAAIALGCSERTVHTLVRTARRKLAENLDKLNLL